VTRRTIARSRPPCIGGTAVLLFLSTTTELVVLHLIPQHNPQSDPEFASYSHSRLPQTLLHQFPAVKTLQLRISAYRVCSRLTPEKAQQRMALFTQPTDAISAYPQPPLFGNLLLSFSMTKACEKTSGTPN
jgi:hypothetical protein